MPKDAIFKKNPTVSQKKSSKNFKSVFPRNTTFAGDPTRKPGAAAQPPARQKDRRIPAAR